MRGGDRSRRHRVPPFMLNDYSLDHSINDDSAGVISIGKFTLDA